MNTEKQATVHMGFKWRLKNLVNSKAVYKNTVTEKMEKVRDRLDLEIMQHGEKGLSCELTVDRVQMKHVWVLSNVDHEQMLGNAVGKWPLEGKFEVL